MRVAISTITEHGHIQSNIGLAKELLARGNEVTFVLTDDCIRAQPPPSHVGDCAQTPTQFFSHLLPSASVVLLPQLGVTPEDIEGFMEEANLGALFELFYWGGASCVRTIQEHHATAPFDLIIADVTANCGIAAAEVIGVPLIISSPIPLYQVAREPLSLRVPSMFIGHGRSVESLLTLRGRLGNLVDHALDVFVLNLVDWRALNKMRAELGLSRVGFLEKVKMEYSPTVRDAWYLQNSFWGLETPRPLSPRIFLIGTSIDIEATLRAVKTRDSATKSGSGGGGWLGFGGGGSNVAGSHDSAARHPALLWLDEPQRRAVVYLSLGTVTRPQASQYAALLKALAPLPIDIIFSVREDMQPRLPQNATAEESPLAAGTAVLFATVPQVAVLAHPRTKAFISHCGANSMSESLALGKPVIGMPIAWDQLGLCDQARIAGAALCVPLDTFSGEALQTVTKRIVFEENDAFSAAAMRQGKLLRFAGGPKKAADVVELLMAVGPEALRDPLAQRPLLVQYNVDVAVITLLALATVSVLVALWLRGIWRAVKAAANGISGVTKALTRQGPAAPRKTAAAAPQQAAVPSAAARNGTGKARSRTKAD